MDKIITSSWGTLCETSISQEKLDEWSWSDLSQETGVGSETENDNSKSKTADHFSGCNEKIHSQRSGDINDDSLDEENGNTPFLRMKLTRAFLFSSLIYCLVHLFLFYELDHAQNITKNNKPYIEGEFVFCQADNTWSYNPNMKSLTLLTGPSIQIDAFIVDWKSNILRRKMDRSKLCSYKNEKVYFEDFDIIFQEPKAKLVDTGAMDIDGENGNLYIIDKSTESIVVIDMYSKKYNFVLSNLEDPLQIVLDSEAGLIFVLQRNNMILRGGMDGSNVDVIINRAHEISSVALDKLNKRVYWIKDKVAIQSSDYDGRDVQTVVGDSEDVITVMTISGGWMFWLWQDHSMEKPVLWHRQLTGDSASFDRTILPFSLFNDIRSVGLVTVVQQRVATSTNQSNLENLSGVCEELRLASPLGRGYRCACALGRRLNPDGKTCRSVSDFMLFTTANLVRGIQLEQPHADVFWPTPYRADLGEKSVIDFDYDPLNDDLYYSDDRHVYRMKLKSDEWRELMRWGVGSTHMVKDVAYDWLGGNLYYSLCSTSRHHAHLVQVTKIGCAEPTRKTLASFDYNYQFGLDGCPYAFALNPAKGDLALTASEDGSRYIVRSNVAGPGSRIPNVSFVHEHRRLTIDVETGRIYWIADGDVVEHAEPDGSDRRSLDASRVAGARSISIYRQWIYLSTADGIWRVRKADGSGEERLVGPNVGQLGGIRIVSPLIQRPMYYGCEWNNGGCEQFCFPAGPKVTCDCKDGQTVQADGRCI